MYTYSIVSLKLTGVSFSIQTESRGKRKKTKPVSAVSTEDYRYLQQHPEHINHKFSIVVPIHESGIIRFEPPEHLRSTIAKRSTRSFAQIILPHNSTSFSRAQWSVLQQGRVHHPHDLNSFLETLMYNMYGCVLGFGELVAEQKTLHL